MCGLARFEVLAREKDIYILYIFGLRLHVGPIWLRFDDMGGSSTRATRVMALVLALKYNGQITIFSIAKLN
jgi:hypothetical protein